MWKLFSKRKSNHYLSDRERDILERIAQGKRNKVIGSELGLTENTVRNQCVPLFRKLGVRNRTEAALKYLKSYR